MRPESSDVVRQVFLALVLAQPLRVVRVRSWKLLVKLIGILEPRAGCGHVQMQRVLRRGIEVNSIKEILIVSVGVHHGKLGRVQKATPVDSIQVEKVPPLLRSNPNIGIRQNGAETAIAG